jgi:nucleolar protein 53
MQSASFVSESVATHLGMQVDNFLERTTREERQGLSVIDGIPDADLFFVDKDPQAGMVAAPADAPPATKASRKAALRNKLTKAEAILEAAHAAQPAAKASKSRPSGKLTTRRPSAKEVAAAKNGTKAAGTDAGNTKPLSNAPVDLWNTQKSLQSNGYLDSNLAEAPATKRRRQRAPAVAPAVEIDLPGCSYNPDREQHQDAVAAAVAAEVRKAIAKELQPLAPPRLAENFLPDEDELAELLAAGQEGESADEEDKEDGGSSDEDAAGAATTKGRARERKNRTDRARNRRRREAETALAKEREEKKVRRELAELGAVNRQVEAGLKEQEARTARRRADLEDKLANEPPRLGRQKFEPMPLQVLTSEEAAGGSLRVLKGTPTLAADRFKSLQRRGLIEPRKKVSKKGKKQVEFVRGRRDEKAEERHAELEELRRTRRGAKSDRPS